MTSYKLAVTATNIAATSTQSTLVGRKKSKMLNRFSITASAVSILILLGVQLLFTPQITHGNSPSEPSEPAQLTPIEEAGKLTKYFKSEAPTRKVGQSATLSEALVLEDTVIAPGGRLRLESSLDFTGAEQISLRVLANTADAFRSGPNPQGSMITLYWRTPPEETYTASYSITTLTGNILGATMPWANLYFNSGGGVVSPVFGTNLLIIISNPRTTPVSIGRVSVYAVAR